MPPDNPGSPKGRSAAEPCLGGWREVAAGPPTRSSSPSLAFSVGQRRTSPLSYAPTGGLANTWLLDAIGKSAFAHAVCVSWVCFPCSYGPGRFLVVFTLRCGRSRGGRTCSAEARRALPAPSSQKAPAGAGSESASTGPCPPPRPSCRLHPASCMATQPGAPRAAGVPVRKGWGLTLFPSCG